ncbi:cellulase family glycosylhydrolase [Chroogloeocystis siderophila]|uniref:cellulase family glycosylhydrolase n=1 Tax=Chroogloeocystis siderophila TaxID=329163 RepID=UPI001F006569|nr:cellulase family glycosylhydrolase [Chroogloeocystis siderophila]
MFNGSHRWHFLWGEKYDQRRSKITFAQLLCLFVLTTTVLIIPALWQETRAITRADTTIQLPLSTQGSKIIDTKGNQVLLRGVNWFGIETELHIPHGLWLRDYQEMLAQIKHLGYNTIRLPYSVQSLRSTTTSGIDYKRGANQELEGKTPLEVMDCIIQEAQRQGLFILLDSHRLNDRQIPELWYGDGFTEQDWIDTWKMLAVRYQNQANVIGADLKNEPHGRASWGTNDLATDWRLAAERAGNAILAINPNWLIVVEGVENNVPGQRLSGHWQGGNLEGVRRYPVRLSRPSQLVYSPHEYGPGVYNQPWFREQTFPNNLYHRWETGFNYIATQNIAPILVGEFGGRYVDNLSKEGIWQQQFVKYIHKNHLSFTYWSWNPNSEDTGGILQDDWQSINVPKQNLLSRLLDNIPFAPATASDAIASKNPIQSPSRKLKVTTQLQSDWQTGFCVSLQVANQSSTLINDWQVSFQMRDATINNIWNATFKKQHHKRSHYILSPEDWAKNIAPNQVRGFGFCATKQGANYHPQQVSVSSL